MTPIFLSPHSFTFFTYAIAIYYYSRTSFKGPSDEGTVYKLPVYLEHCKKPEISFCTSNNMFTTS